MHRILVVFIACAMVIVAQAAPNAFTVGATQTLYNVNVANNSDVGLWSTGFATDSLAKDAAGNLYSADANGLIFNVTSPFAVPVGPTGFTQIGDLDFGVGGLWGFSNGNQSLFFFDLGLATVTYSVTLSSFVNEMVTGVAFDSTNGSVFLSANTGFNADKLYSVAAAATSATFIGNMSHSDTPSYISDIDFDGGTLYAMTWFNRHFYSVNTGNGALSLVSSGPHRDATGMAFDSTPVPEPGTICLSLGAFALLRRRRKASR